MIKKNKIVKPVDAGSLVIYQMKGQRIQVLMGRRGSKAKFQPGFYVFPGGVLEKSDHKAKFTNKIDQNSIKYMAVGNKASKANSLALTSIREAYEEVGLVFGKRIPSTEKKTDGKWEYFQKNNICPDLGVLEYLGRAITPNYLPIRYHARFFSINIKHLLTKETADGELEDIKWVDLEETDTVKMMGVQKMILNVLKTRLCTGELRPKFLFFKWNRKNIV